MKPDLLKLCSFPTVCSCQKMLFDHFVVSVMCLLLQRLVFLPLENKAHPECALCKR